MCSRASSKVFPNTFRLSEELTTTLHPHPQAWAHPPQPSPSSRLRDCRALERAWLMVLSVESATGLHSMRLCRSYLKALTEPAQQMKDQETGHFPPNQVKFHSFKHLPTSLSSSSISRHTFSSSYQLPHLQQWKVRSPQLSHNIIIPKELNIPCSKIIFPPQISTPILSKPSPTSKVKIQLSYWIIKEHD